MRDPLELVAKHMRLPLGPIKAGDRGGEMVRARYAAAWIYRNRWQHPPMCLVEIGRSMGGFEHSTVRSAILKAEQYREKDPVFRAMTDRLLEKAREQ